MWGVLRRAASKKSKVRDTTSTCLTSDFYSRTTVSKKPHSTSTRASLTASAKTVVTVRSESTEARHNATGW